MTHFPVTNSTLSAHHLAIFIADKYALGGDTCCRLMRAGINDTYVVENGGGKYVLRVYSYGWHTRVEIQEEINLLKELIDKRIPVSYPLPDKNGAYIHTINAPEGERFAVLFSYAPGEKLHNYEVDMHFRIGAVMAAFHNATINKRLERITYTPEVLLVQPLKQIAEFLSGDTPEMELMLSMQQYLLDALSHANIAQLRQGVVHLDIWFDNLNITGDGVATIFDFDFCGNGWLCLDIAYNLMQLYVVEPDEQEYRRKAAAFLSGYESVAAISDEERRLLPMLGVCLYFFYLGTQCQRFDNFSSVFISETYLKRYITQRIKRHFDFHKLG